MDHVTYYVRFYLIEIKYCLQDSGLSSLAVSIENVRTEDWLWWYWCGAGYWQQPTANNDFRVLDLNLSTPRPQPPAQPQSTLLAGPPLRLDIWVVVQVRVVDICVTRSSGCEGGATGTVVVALEQPVVGRQ